MNFVLAGIATMGIKPRIPVSKFSAGQARPRIIPPRTDFARSPLFWTFVCLYFVGSSVDLILHLSVCRNRLSSPGIRSRIALYCPICGNGVIPP